MADYKYGDTFTVFSRNPEKEKQYLKHVEEVKEELKSIKNVTFYMEKWMLQNISSRIGNTSLLYKRVVSDIDPRSGRPDYKPHYVYFKRGQCRTANPEQIAFLDMKDGFVREEDRELTPMEQQKYELVKMKAEKEKLEAEVAKLKENKAEEIVEEDIKEDIKTEKKAKKKNETTRAKGNKKTN